MVWWLFLSLTFSINWHGTIAQSNASCLPFYNWTFNSVHQSPCQVASSLLAVCNGGPFPVFALPDASHYEGPSLQDANPCQCNTVTYSLMSACGACQGDTYLLWSVWSANCPAVYLDSFPKTIPSGVFVPGWAYLDVQADDNFDQFLARMNANLTQSTAASSPTSTKQSMMISSLTSSTALPPSSSTSSSPSTSAVDASANAVEGGVVGGILGLFILCGLFYGYLQWNKRFAHNRDALSSPTDMENPASSEAEEEPSVTQVRAINLKLPRSGLPSFNYSLSTPATSTSNSRISWSTDVVRSPNDRCVP